MLVLFPVIDSPSIEFLYGDVINCADGCESREKLIQVTIGGAPMGVVRVNGASLEVSVYELRPVEFAKGDIAVLFGSVFKE